MKSVLISLAGIFLLALAGNSQANKVKKMDIDAPDGFSQAPRVKVYSSKGEKWDRIDKTASTMIQVRLNAECKYEGKGNKAYRGSMTVPGYTAQGDPDRQTFLSLMLIRRKGNFVTTRVRGNPSIRLLPAMMSYKNDSPSNPIKPSTTC